MSQIEELLDALTREDGNTLHFGVRHHSPACARALVEAAEEWKPEAIAVELPAELAETLPWLAHPETIAPVAVAVAGTQGPGIYPFADFSPELAILRWARANAVPVRCIDLPAGVEITEDDYEDSEIDASELISQESWDTRIEARAPGESWRQVRRAALAVGLGVRMAQSRIDAHTAAREANMRACLAELEDQRTLVVVGSFHCLGLLDGPTDAPANYPKAATSLLPYSFAQLDSRSGYASGIRDPRWQQGTWEGEPDLTLTVLISVARAMRRDGEPAGSGEIAEANRMAGDLAALRGLPGPGRREAIEALTSVFAHGSVLGRGRVIARALEKVMIGEQRGKLAPGAPASALLAQVTALLEELGLPSAETQKSRQVRIEPFSNHSQLRKHVTLTQLEVLNIPYARDKSGGQVRGLEARGYTVTCDFSVSTTAALGTSIMGVTLEQAVESLLNRAIAAWEGETHELLELTQQSAGCGLARPLATALELVETDLRPRLDFASAVQATELLQSIAGGREPATALLPEGLIEVARGVAKRLGDAVIRELPGVQASDQERDALLLAGITGLVEEHQLRATAALREMAAGGSPLMKGAALAVLHQLGAVDDPTARLSSLVDHCALAPEPARTLAGFLLASRGVWSESGVMDGAVSRVENMSDATFVNALPRLRSCFDVVAPAERERFLDHLAQRIGAIPKIAADPETLAANANADQAARQRLEALGLLDVSFTPATRWRLILGAEPGALGERAGKMASTLDELYGSPGDDPSGESDGRIGAGNEPGQVGVREWTEDIEALFGENQLQEIIGQAAARGRGDVVEQLDPEQVRPSVELLTTMLNLSGALPEARLRKIRPLVRRVVDELSAALATKLQPALRGAPSTVPVRRKSPTLDLAATVRRNLRHTVLVDGIPRIVPATPYFRRPDEKTSPWHIIVLVDVSGSMEASTVYAAMTAAILTGVHTYRVSFLTFDTQVVDLSEHSGDPLQLLLEISVGGGTDIARAVRYAATQVTVPARTALILVSDFYEYGDPGPLLHEIRTLAESGVHLIGCAALDDEGGAVYNVAVTEMVAAAGMRVAQLSPLELARWVGEVLQ